METVNNVDWENLTSEEKRRELYDRQVTLLDIFDLNDPMNRVLWEE